jgi:hypothetical protein
MSSASSKLEEAQALAASNPAKAAALYKQILDAPAGPARAAPARSRALTPRPIRSAAAHDRRCQARRAAPRAGDCACQARRAPSRPEVRARAAAARRAGTDACPARQEREGRRGGDHHVALFHVIHCKGEDRQAQCVAPRVRCAPAGSAEARSVVRTLLDFFAAIPDSGEVQTEVLRDNIEWAQREKRIFLKQSLETRLIALYVSPSLHRRMCSPR